MFCGDKSTNSHHVLHSPQPKNVLSSHRRTIWTPACLLMVGQSSCLLMSTHLSACPSASFWSQCVGWHEQHCCPVRNKALNTNGTVCLFGEETLPAQTTQRHSLPLPKDDDCSLQSCFVCLCLHWEACNHRWPSFCSVCVNPAASLWGHGFWRAACSLQG